MATIREIKRRIQAVKSTQKITRAMRMVAAAKLKKAQESIIKTRPYSNEMESIIARVAYKTVRNSHPLLSEPESNGKTLLVVVTADSGLCGGFNSNTIKAVQKYLDDNTGKTIDIYCIGRKGKDFLKRKGLSIVGDHSMFFSKMKYKDAVSIIKSLKEHFLSHEYDRVDIIYNEFGSAIRQVLKTKTILPLTPGELKENESNLEYVFEPGEYEILDTIIPYHLEIQMWRILQESYASEMGAKMTAMDSASENAKDFLNTLTIGYNRARQAVITKELSEIVGGMVGLNS